MWSHAKTDTIYAVNILRLRPASSAEELNLEPYQLRSPNSIQNFKMLSLTVEAQLEG